MNRLALLLLVSLTVTGCSTLGKWASDSMDWADRTMPTYDDLFGDEATAPQSHQQSTYDYQQPQSQQQHGYPPAQVESQPMIAQQEIYYDNSERGHSFGR